MSGYIKSFWNYVREHHLKRSELRYFDWRLFAIVTIISLFGVISIFSATSSGVTEDGMSLATMLRTQSIYYPRLQLIWYAAGVVAMFGICFLPYKTYQKAATFLYVANILMLVFTKLVAQVGRGGMQAFLTIGSSERGLQPSEFGKIAIIIALSEVLSRRKYPVKTFRDFMLLALYVALPAFLIFIQPDFGTALVYFAVFVVLLFVSDMDLSLIIRLILILIIVAIPFAYAMMNTNSFRVTRILSWLHPEEYPDDARQVINGQIAVGSGGLFGKGIVSAGSFGSLGYISDDHTDFIFSIVCESFGLVGGIALIVLYALMILDMVIHAVRISDPFGSMVIFGVIAMLLFHIIENICMVIGLLPVTGIPLPFMSYGGSNMLTNMMGIGLVENVIVRTSIKEKNKLHDSGTPLSL